MGNKQSYTENKDYRQRVMTMIINRSNGVSIPLAVRKSLSLFDNSKAAYLQDDQVAFRTFQVLQQRGFKPFNTLFATSICPDEINSQKGNLAFEMFAQWGEVFNMGGLAGIPFCGKTGFGAFAAHIPQDGNIVLLFGPHIGIDRDGTVGKFHRTGQDCNSTACGAAIGAFEFLKQNENVENDAYDLQMDWIKSQLKPYFEQIRDAPNQQVELAQVMYKILEEKIFKIVHTNYEGQLCLLGGIQVNITNEPFVFIPKCFKVLQKGQPEQDILHLITEPKDFDRLQDLTSP